MAVVRLLDRIKDEMAEVWERRRAPDDEIFFDASVTLIPLLHTGDDDDDPHLDTQSAVSVYISLACPESGSMVHSVAHVIVPMNCVQADGGPADLANDLWDRLNSSRIVHSLGLDSADHPDGA